MTRDEVYACTLRHFFKPVADLLYDDAHDDVSEVMINGPADIYLERAGRIERAGHRSFRDADELMAAVRNLAEYVGRSIGGTAHSMDARLPVFRVGPPPAGGPAQPQQGEKFRVHVITPPCARNGVCVTIRKFRRNNTTLDWLIGNGSITAEAAEYLRLAVRSLLNVVVAGGTGSGKTSLLNALSVSIPDRERVVVIEDSSELLLLSEADPLASEARAAKPHVVYLESRPPDPDGNGGVTIRDLFVDSLRMRPDRILMGEVRRGEALDLVQSMLSGHDGALSTVHASSPRLALVRLETLALMNDVNMPVHVARTQVSQAIHVVAQVARYPDGRRRVCDIAEVCGSDDKRGYRLRSMFRFERAGRDPDGGVRGHLVHTGKRSRFSRHVLDVSPEGEISRTKKIWGLNCD
ncbi:MAG: Flp pilus assembly complex ATPase component TadA [Fimbriiglobus sp.]|jgi:pilus assembly protein CpaF|nr:Flp pilus assembly complex ATPase component TadA [Fimbriiglobus sp.]